MGCAHSQNNRNLFKKINDHDVFLSPHNKLFKVTNIDEQGNAISFGKIEVTKMELILHQTNKKPIKWPLILLRRYGHDKRIFSFECGRRCTTGEGVYAFKCNEAEELFNVLRIAIENSPKINEESLIDQINDQKFNNNQINDHQQSPSKYSLITNQQSEIMLLNNVNNHQVNHSISHQEFNQHNNLVQSIPPNHLYANDMREYMNSTVFNNGFILKDKDDNSPLIKNGPILLDYAELENVKLNPTTNQNKNQSSIQNDLFSFDNDQESNERRVNYTVLDIKALDIKSDGKFNNNDNSNDNNNNGNDSNDNNDNNNNEDLTDSVTVVTTEPVTPIHKTIKFNEFKIPSLTNSVPTSPTTIQESNFQQYSTIDFDKTKALTEIRLDHH